MVQVDLASASAGSRQTCVLAFLRPCLSYNCQAVRVPSLTDDT